MSLPPGALVSLFRIALPALVAGLLSASPAALAGMSLTGKPKVKFHAEGSPNFLTFDGVTRELTVDDDGTNLVFTVPMDTVTTGIELRDDHMRKTYVQTDKFPHVVLTVPRAGIIWPADGDSAEGTVTGSFEAHGVTLEVPVTYEIKHAKGEYRVKATYPFNTSKHGIEIPTYLGVTIDPAMQAEVQLELVDG